MSASKSVDNWDFYEDRPAGLSSTKPTEFQQYLNTHPVPKSEEEYYKRIQIVPGMGADWTLADVDTNFLSDLNKAKTYDEGKLPLAWLPWAALDGLAEVQQYGHSKYNDYHNYRKGMEVSRNLSCALRHIRDFMEGHNIDVESGCHPLKHALCRIAFVLQNIHDGVAIDDRYVQPQRNLMYTEVVDGEALIKEWGRHKP